MERTIKEELINYCNLCLNDVRISEYEDYISCDKHKRACKRLLDDFKRENTEEFPYYWDEKEAKKIVKFASYLHHSKGELAGKPIILTSWQKFFMCQLYGWRHKETKKRRFTKVFIECSRKQAKSQMQGIVGLYELSVTAVKNGELTENYTAGVKRKQSKIIFEEMKLMLKGSVLAPKFKITRDKIIHTVSGSYCEPLSKEDGKSGDGTNINLLILDEYHQHQTTEFYDLFLGANSQEPLLIIITTAGMNLNAPCFTQEYKYCTDLLNRAIINETYFCDICETDDGDNIDDMRIWWKSNPIRMSYSEGVKKIKEAYDLAKQTPEKMVAFKTKCLCIWVQSVKDTYIPNDKFEACIVKKFPIDIKGKDVFIGVDLASKNDLCGITFHIPFNREIDNKICICSFSYAFVPNMDSIQFHIKNDKMPFDLWLQKGWIKTTETIIVNQDKVIDFCYEVIEKYGFKNVKWCLDPSGASAVETRLLEDNQEVFEIWNSKKHISEATKMLRDNTVEGNVYYLENDCVKWQFNNAYVLSDENDNIKIDKKAQRYRIDNVDSNILASKLSFYWKPKKDLNAYILSDDFFI